MCPLFWEVYGLLSKAGKGRLINKYRSLDVRARESLEDNRSLSLSYAFLNESKRNSTSPAIGFGLWEWQTIVIGLCDRQAERVSGASRVRAFVQDHLRELGILSTRPSALRTALPWRFVELEATYLSCEWDTKTKNTWTSNSHGHGSKTEDAQTQDKKGSNAHPKQFCVRANLEFEWHEAKREESLFSID